MKRAMNRVMAVSILICLGAPAVAKEPSSTSGSHYYYFKEPRPLTLDASRIAILSAPNSAESVHALPEAVPELAVQPATGLVVRDWYLSSLKSNDATLEVVHSAVSKTSQQPAMKFSSPVFKGLEGGPVIVTPTILVAFHPAISGEQAEAILAEANAGFIKDRNWARMPGSYRFETAARDGFEVLEIANALARRPEVKYAEPDFLFTGRGSLIPNDALFGDAWGIHNTGQVGGTVDADMDGPEAWDITTGDASIKVLIMDTGVQQNHPDINQLPGADVTSDGPGGGGNPINSCDNHGTPVAGCVSSIINNNIGALGIAPSCKSVSVRFAISNLSCNGSWSGQSSWTVDALAFGESVGVRVTNNSNGYGALASAAIETKYQQTYNNGMVHFASAMNDGQPFSGYPASLPTVNSIAALERHGNRAAFSNYGADLFISAPGEDIITTDRTGGAGWVGGDYVFANGTSFASPYTAGVAALVLSINPGLPSSSVESILASSAVEMGIVGWDTDFGWGFVNAHRALVFTQGGCNDPGPPDCNENGVSDECDIFDGTSPDCNSNEIPDECESTADCQPNGIFDICDLATGASFDCNGNTVPDECDLGNVSLDCNANLVPDECDAGAVLAVTNTRPAVHGFLDISGTGTPLNLTDDSSSDVTIPFAPPALPSSSARISNNGAVGFNTTADVSNPNEPLPSAAMFNYATALLPYWDDLDATTGNVFHQTIGDAPNRVFVVQWHNRPLFPGDAVLDGDEGTFQLQIFETPVDAAMAQYLYQDTNFMSAGGNNGRSATCGYQRGPQIALQYSHNTINSLNPGVVVTLLETDCQGNGVPDSCELAGGAPDCNANQIIDQCDIEDGVDPDCNGNSTPDSCDVNGGEPDCDGDLVPDECEADCQPNGVPDDCDILMGTSLDTDANSIPDECDRPEPAQSDPSGIDKSRFASLRVPPTQTAMGNSTALRFTLVSLHHVVPPYTGGPSVPFTSFEGQVRWVGPPSQYLESISTGTPFIASMLQCTPHYQDWTTVELLHVTGSAIVPSSVYEVENVAASCVGNEAGCASVSEPLVISTTRWGDVETPYNPPSSSVQPDLGDVSALVNKFRSAPDAPIKARALLVGGDSVGTIDMASDFSFIHIAACVDAFRGRPYPHAMEGCP